MGIYRGSEYYDAIYVNNFEHLELYVPIYKRIVELAAPYKAILDLGCGVGNLSAMLRDKLSMACDFSMEAISRARKNNPEIAEKFIVFDATAGAAFSSFDCVILCEVLEHLHIPDWQKVFESFGASGTAFIVTVPNYDDPSHVIHFRDQEEVRFYLNPFLKIESIEEIQIGSPSSKIFIVKGVRP